MIYFGYGMWNSSLELTAQEEKAHASSYQRYDAGVDDSFVMDDPAEDGQEGNYQGWAAEEKGYQYQNQYQNEHRKSSRNPKASSRTYKGYQEFSNEYEATE